MGFLIIFLSIWVCGFAIGRIFSRYSKTYWKNDLVISFAQSLIITIILVLSLNCFDDSTISTNENLELINPWDAPVNITEEEAIEIALEQAEVDGHKSVTLWEKDPVFLRAVYSIKYDRDLLVYDVRMSTPGELWGAYYYVSTENGELIDSVH